MKLTWATELRLTCERFGVAFFFKQLGGPRPKSGGRLFNGKEWNGFPTHTVPKHIFAGLS